MFLPTMRKPGMQTRDGDHWAPPLPQLWKQRMAGKGCRMCLGVCSTFMRELEPAEYVSPTSPCQPFGGHLDTTVLPHLSSLLAPPHQPRFFWPLHDPLYISMAAFCVACSLVSEWCWQNHDHF